MNPPQGIRDIDASKINQAATEVAELAHAIATRGLVVTLFGIPLRIKLGPEKDTDT